MTDKKTFGAFIRSKRAEKNYSQKELAEMLFVTESAVSKWERGISYPDITLISDICRVLDISEHEFITASTDTAERKIKRESRKFRIIRSVWFWVPTISYAVALLTCFICNLAVNHTLSWFYIVLSALICAYTFIPTVTSFFKAQKLLVFSVSSYLAICLLLFTCAVYTDDLSWFITACIGTLMGYIQLFLPMLLSKTDLSRYKFIISFTATFILTVLLLLNIYTRRTFMLGSAILITCYAFIPAIFGTVICIFRFDGFLKAGICTLLGTVVYYFTRHVVNALFGTTGDHYTVDFNNWEQHLTGNVQMICLLSFLVIGAIFLTIGFVRTGKLKEK